MFILGIHFFFKETIVITQYVLPANIGKFPVIIYL